MSQYEVYVESYARIVVCANSEEDAEEAYRNLSQEYIANMLYENIGSPEIKEDS